MDWRKLTAVSSVEIEPREVPGRWYADTANLRRELKQLLDLDRIRALHRVSLAHHVFVAVRQFLLLVGCALLIVWAPERAYVWVPAAVLLGFVLFSLTILLHEVVHQAVFERRRTPWNAVLGWLYALPTGLSRSQFTRWHLDHHAELGSDKDDPKRHHLTPKIVRRWYKALYLTPYLFPLYFRAAMREARGYEPALRSRLRVERTVTMLLHVGLVAAIVHWGSWALLLRVYVIPLFFVFPIAFTVNRLGQHYDIEPDDPAAWGTIIKTNGIWNFLFLWSSYHMEHHYFPGVPFYNLPALHRELRPVLERHPMRVRTYTGLLFDWLIRNKAPHTSWH